MPKQRKIEPGGKEWQRRANAVARDFVTLGTCADCGSPHVQNYQCTFCGSTCPEGGCDD